MKLGLNDEIKSKFLEDGRDLDYGNINKCRGEREKDLQHHTQINFYIT